MATRRTANPALNSKTFWQWETDAPHLPGATEAERTSAVRGEVMTLQGAVNKTFLLTAVLVAAGGWTWHVYYAAQQVAAVMPYVWAGLLSGFISALAIIFKKEWAPVLSPAYCLFEGFAIGGLSAMLEAQYPGIVIQAVGLTAGTLVALLCAYSSRLIQPSENFKLGVVAATGGIAIVYLVDIGLRAFAGMHVPLINDSGPWGIVVSAFIVLIAALNLVLDFDFIETGARVQAPKYMEWYAAFGLMVTLVWLYLEILRMLAKSRRR